MKREKREGREGRKGVGAEGEERKGEEEERKRQISKEYPPLPSFLPPFLLPFQPPQIPFQPPQVPLSLGSMILFPRIPPRHSPPSLLTDQSHGRQDCVGPYLRHEAFRDIPRRGGALSKIDEKAHGHDRHQEHEDTFQFSDPEIVDAKESEGVDESDEAPEPQGEAEKDLKGDRTADNLLEVAADDGQLY